MNRNRCCAWSLVLMGVLLLATTQAVAGGVSPAPEAGWESLGGPTVPGGTVYALAVAPAAPHPLYAVMDDRVCRSDDGADSWTPVYTTTMLLSALAVHPTDPAVVYAGNASALLRTTDGGLGWQQVYTLGADIAIDPVTPTTVYVCGQLRDWNPVQPPVAGVARSDDGGDTWTVSPVSGTYRLDALVIDPVTPAILYTGGTGQYEKGKAIYKSTDSGLSWARVFTATYGNSAIWDLLVDPLHPQTVYANSSDAIYKSVDGGAHWQALPNLPDGHEVVTLDPQSPHILYVVGGYPSFGLYKSYDGGETWWQSLSHFPEYVRALIVHPTTSSTLYAGLANFGIHRSANAGGSWSEANAGLRTEVYVNALTVDPNAPNTVLAGSEYRRGGLFRSADGGSTWATVLTDTHIATVFMYPLTPTLAFAGGSALYQSIDGGWHWYQYHDLSLEACRAIATSADTLYVGGSQSDGGWTQGAVAWRSLAGWDPDWYTISFPDSHSIQALAVHPLTPTIVLAGSEGRHHGATADIYRSQDGGLNWTMTLSDTGHGIDSIAFDPRSPHTAYAVGMLGVYRSTDSGITWNLLGPVAGLLDQCDLTVDSCGVVYVSTWNGVYCSWDGGVQWKDLGLNSELVWALALTPGHPQRILAGTPSGVWRRWETRATIYLPVVFKGLHG